MDERPISSIEEIGRFHLKKMKVEEGYEYFLVLEKIAPFEEAEKLRSEEMSHLFNISLKNAVEETKISGDSYQRFIDSKDIFHLEDVSMDGKNYMCFLVNGKVKDVFRKHVMSIDDEEDIVFSLKEIYGDEIFKDRVKYRHGIRMRRKYKEKEMLKNSKKK